MTSRVRAAISNAYYECRKDGQTMETAADVATAAVRARLADIRAIMANELALEFAKQRTGGSVYMDGSHNPTPTERSRAERLLDGIDYLMFEADAP